MPEDSLALLAIVVGNTNTRFGVFHGKELLRADRAPNADFEALVERIIAIGADLPEADQKVAVLASDNPPISDRLFDELAGRLNAELFRIGEDLEIPLPRALAPEARPGQDRLLNCLAAYDVLQQACVVVDAGTAITVDFVDGHGTFQGGAIAPGANMSLRALHEHTAALPEIAFAPPAHEAFGKDTREAMLQGVFHGARGLVRALVERYAEAYEAYPTVIATGSDAPALFEGDELIDRIVPDLTLRGVEVACRRLAIAD